MRKITAIACAVILAACAAPKTNQPAAQDDLFSAQASYRQMMNHYLKNTEDLKQIESQLLQAKARLQGAQDDVLRLEKTYQETQQRQMNLENQLKAAGQYLDQAWQLQRP